MKKCTKAELARMLSEARVEPAALFVAIGRERFPVASIEDASRIWSSFVDHIDHTTGDGGFSRLGNGYRVVNATNKLIARISYNGRVWPHQETTPNRKELTMTRKTSKKTTAKKQTKSEIVTAEPEVVTTASKMAAAKAAKAKAPKQQKAPREDLVVFAFRLSQTERDAIHKAAGPAGASRFVRSLAVAAASGDEAQVRSIIKNLPSLAS